MLNKNAKKWIAALRSGDYKQGKYCLGRITDDGIVHCCLGVACEIYGAEHPDFVCDKDETRLVYDKQKHYLPVVVKDWLALASEDGKFMSDAKLNSLEDINDGCPVDVSFDEIADLIESEPTGLFCE